MDPSQIAGYLGLLAGVIGGITAVVTKKTRAPSDDTADKKVVIEGGVAYLTAGASIITQVQGLLTAQATAHETALTNLRAEHTSQMVALRAELKGDTTRIQNQLDEMTRERPLLIQIIHTLARLARKYGGAEAEAELRQIKTPAKDVDLLK